MDLKTLGMTDTIPEDARSEEHMYDKRFIKRWADRCIEMNAKYGWQIANDYAKSFFSKELLKEINAEINGRKKK